MKKKANTLLFYPLGHYLTYWVCKTVAIGEKEMATVYEMAKEACGDKRKENEFIMMMEPKVKKVAYKYISSVKGASEYRDDIENAARIGIHRALMRFDFTYSGFDSYMERAMDMEVRSFLSDGLRTIRLPKHMIESIRKYRNGDEYLSVEKERKVKEAMKREECISLDASFSGDDRGRTLSETISSSSYVEEEYEKMESISVLEKALGMLDGEELYVIATSFGVLDHPKKKAKAVAEELGVSVGTIAARKKNGMRKLRSYLMAC